MNIKLTNINVCEEYKINLKFSDGTKGVVDFSKYVGKGVYSRWSDYGNFQTAHIGDFGELAWDGEIDFCSDSLYLKLSGKKPEELFEVLGKQHA